MKSREDLKELRSSARPELLQKMKDFEDEMMKLRFRTASGETRHGARLKALRRNVARAKTVLREQLMSSQSIE